MSSSEHPWSVDDHLRSASASSVELYRRLESTIASFGPVTLSVSKSSITFKGSRRGFAGARPTAHGVVGYFDLMRQLPADHRLKSTSPYGRNLFVHHYLITDAADLDADFVSWLEEAYAVGCGAHLLPPPT